MCDDSYVAQPLSQLHNFIKLFSDEVVVFNSEDDVADDDDGINDVGEE